MPELATARASRCVKCREADYDLVIGGQGWHVECALEIFGARLEELAEISDVVDEPSTSKTFAVIECGRCEGWMLVGLGSECLGCGSDDLRVVTLV